MYVVTGPTNPTPLDLRVSSAGLNPGTSYTGNIEFDSSSFSILNLPITLNINPASASARFAVTPSPVSIGIRKDTTSSTVNFTLTNLTPATVSLSVTPTVANSRNWLSVSPSALVLQANESTTFRRKHLQGRA